MAVQKNATRSRMRASALSCEPALFYFLQINFWLKPKKYSYLQEDLLRCNTCAPLSQFFLGSGWPHVQTVHMCLHTTNNTKRGFLKLFLVLYSTLFHLPPFGFQIPLHCNENSIDVFPEK